MRNVLICVRFLHDWWPNLELNFSQQEETVLISLIIRALGKLYILQYRKVYYTKSYKLFICFSSVYALWVEINFLWLYITWYLLLLVIIFRYTHLACSFKFIVYPFLIFSSFFFVIWYVFIITVFLPEGSHCKFLYVLLYAFIVLFCL